jgi:hypothetical protein
MYFIDTRYNSVVQDIRTVRIRYNSVVYTLDFRYNYSAYTVDIRYISFAYAVDIRYNSAVGMIWWKLFCATRHLKGGKVKDDVTELRDASELLTRQGTWVSDAHTYSRTDVRRRNPRFGSTSRLRTHSNTLFSANIPFILRVMLPVSPCPI